MKFVLINILILHFAYAIKGEYATDESPPQVCMIKFKIACDTNASKVCSGACSSTFIGNQKIMTADHCLDSLAKATESSVECPNGETRQIKQRITAKGAGMGTAQDVGLLVLDKDFSMPPMKVVAGKEEFNQLMREPKNCFMAGYGLDNDEKWGKLITAQTKVVEVENIRRTNNGFTTFQVPEQILLKENYADHGDSGGAYYCKRGNENILMGVLQGGTKGSAHSYVEKLLQPKEWIDFHNSHLAKGGNDLFKRYHWVAGFCESVLACMSELKEMSSLNKDVSAILKYLNDEMQIIPRTLNIEHYSDAKKFNDDLLALSEKWIQIHRACYDSKYDLK